MKKQFIFFGIGAVVFDYFFINKSCQIKADGLTVDLFKKTTNTTTANQSSFTSNTTINNTKEEEDQDNSSLLNLYKNQLFYQDHFVTEIVINNSDTNNLTIEDFAKAYLTSPFYTPQLLFSSITKDDINNKNKIKFNIGESIEPLEIINKKNNKELLFHHKEGPNSLTWLKIVKKGKKRGLENVNNDSNSNKDDDNDEKVTTCYELHYGTALFDRSLVGKLLMSVSIPLHYLYARYLLAGAKQTLQKKINKTVNNY
ncbi:hypothetical protein ABK040_002005 [Willaertia magna]